MLSDFKISAFSLLILAVSLEANAKRLCTFGADIVTEWNQKVQEAQLREDAQKNSDEVSEAKILDSVEDSIRYISISKKHRDEVQLKHLDRLMAIEREATVARSFYRSAKEKQNPEAVAKMRKLLSQHAMEHLKEEFKFRSFLVVNLNGMVDRYADMAIRYGDLAVQARERGDLGANSLFLSLASEAQADGRRTLEQSLVVDGEVSVLKLKVGATASKTN
jgi:hypothetical protein